VAHRTRGRYVRPDDTRKNALYAAARAEAQAIANTTGCDRGLEWNELMGYWRHFGLPNATNRTGHELRCEVVSCEVWERVQPGHGGKPENLDTRIAAALRWSRADVQTFSLPALRDLLRPNHAKLAHELDVIIRSGESLIIR
jgi:hypothetical protein